MTLPDFGPRAAAAIKTQQILWFALISSVAMFVVVAFVAVKPNDEAMQPMMPFLFGAVSLSTLAVSVVLPMNALKTGLAKARFETVERAVPSSDILPGAAQPKARFFASPAQVMGQVQPLFQTGLILTLALRESVGLYGIVLRQMGAPPAVAGAFFAVSILTMLPAFPSLEGQARRVEALTGTRFG